MARPTHAPVSTPNADPLRFSDAPLEGSDAGTGAIALDRSTMAHIAPRLRALVVPIDCVELHPRNPRRGDVAAVAASLARFRQVKPIVVQRSTGYVIAGNHVLHLGGYDDTLLAAILAEQQAADNLAATGYDVDDVATLLAEAGIIEERDLDAVPDVPAEAEVYVKRGQMWALGRHRLMCGDSTAAEDVARLVGDD